MTTKRILVLYGGRADENSISCISAAEILTAMDTSRFLPIPVGITESGHWLVGDTDPRQFDLTEGSLPKVLEGDQTRPVILSIGKGSDGFFAQSNDGGLDSLGHIDAVFPILHGPYGEDGTIQGLLETMGVPYVGCGVFTSAACMDKHFTKILLSAAGIAVTPGVTVDTRRFDSSQGFVLEARDVLGKVHSAGLSYPLFVKPSRAGSSFGVTKVEDPQNIGKLANAILLASQHDWKVLIEQGVQGREVECAVLTRKTDQEPMASLPGEVVLDRVGGGKDQFYDFDSKYLDDQASHVEVPAKLAETTLQEVRHVAIEAFKALGGVGLSRVDTFVTEQGEVIVNEINTMPGFTPISMYSKVWDATGVGHTELITRLIEGALSHLTC